MNVATTIKKLALEYLDSADKVRLKAELLRLEINNKTMDLYEIKKIEERINLLMVEYHDTKNIGISLLNYYKHSKI